MNEEIPDPVAAEPEVVLPETPKLESSWETWSRTPNPHTLSGVLKSVGPVIQTAVSRYPGINKNLMMGESKRLAIQAIKTYDPARGTSLSTHVFGHLKPLGRFAEKETKVVSVPRDFKTEVASFIKARQGFMEEEGREPSDAEMQDMLGIGKKKLQKLNVGAFYEMPEGQTESDIDIGQQDDSPSLNLWVDYVYHDLPARDKMIMDYRLGKNGRPVKEPNEIAAIMKIDPSYVRKRTTAISKQILEGLNKNNN